MQAAKATLDSKALRKIARKLQAGHAKETTGDVTPWTDLADEERSLWIRLATRAANATLQELHSLPPTAKMDLPSANGRP
jgi:hypothetical protein